jgi:DNA-directed RNA polymerase subunit RPC12/RpoP
MKQWNQLTWRSPLVWALIVAAAGGIFWIFGRSSDRVPSYDWECAKCHYHFRKAIRDAASDLPVIDCPKCHAPAAERVMHYQCRKCWKKYDLRGNQAVLANIVCPACASRAVRDLDNPIPGDDEPVEGGLPKPK